MNYSWNLQIEGNAKHPTFSSKAIFGAFARMQRYWAVTFPQVASNPWWRIVLTNRLHGSGNRNVAAWTTGRSIYLPNAFKFSSVDQALYVVLHEFGHVLGGPNHGAPNDVMAAGMTDIYRNFTLNDSKWFRMPWKASVRPWLEMNQWRTTRDSFHWENSPGGEFAHAQWIDRWHQLTSRHSILKVEE